MVVLTMIISGSIFAQDEWKLSGQLQIRSELDGRDFSNRTHFLSFTSMRTRIGVEKTFQGKVNFFAQVQDSRVFGQEASLTANSQNVDLKQGYIKLINPFDLNMTLQAGRFVMSYGTERFFGASDWTYIGRSWDGVRLSFDPGFKLDVFGLTQKETVGYISSAIPTSYPYPEPSTPATSLYGFWSTFNVTPMSKIDAFGYYNVNRAKVNAAGDLNLERYTVGLNYTGNYDLISTILEGAYQFGKIQGVDISAYLLSGQIYYNVNPISLGLGADIYSGTEATADKWNTVSTEFGTGHKFLGYMDYFGIPVEGINDFYFMSSWTPAESKFSGQFNMHYFISNKPYTVISLTPVDMTNTYGGEFDIVLKYAFVQGTNLSWGASMFVPGDLMKLNFSGTNYSRTDNGYWTYIMLQTAL